MFLVNSRHEVCRVPYTKLALLSTDLFLHDFVITIFSMLFSCYATLSSFYDERLFYWSVRAPVILKNLEIN